MEISIHPKTRMSQVRGGAEFGVQLTLLVKANDIEEIKVLRQQWDVIDTSEDVDKMIDVIKSFEEKSKSC